MIADICVSMRAEDWLQLPELVIHDVPVALEGAGLKAYRAMEKTMVAEVNGEEISATTAAALTGKLLQLCGGAVYDENGEAHHVHDAKLEALEDIIDSCVEENKKVVVFARFVPEIDSIAKMLRKKNIGYALIKGDVSDRAEQVEAFQTDPDVKVFIGQLQTTGMGLTLTAGTVAVYYSLDFSYANYEQSRARIRRIGQTKRGVYIHLVCKNTIDEKVMATLKQKADVSKLLVDDYKQLIGG